MTMYEIATLVLSVTAVLVIPLAIVLIRGAVKWTRVEAKLDQAIARLDQIVHDKDQTHNAMMQQMTDDRRATDRRLRWLEENVWRTPERNRT